MPSASACKQDIDSNKRFFRSLLVWVLEFSHSFMHLGVFLTFFRVRIVVTIRFASSLFNCFLEWRSSWGLGWEARPLIAKSSLIEVRKMILSLTMADAN